jgi:hypothetical protein
MNRQAELFDTSGIFSERDPLVGLKAEETGPEIAAALGLPTAPDVIGVVESFIRRYAVMPDAAYLPVALWCAATYLAEIFDAFPYIAVLSPIKGCGKTRVLEILEQLCGKAWRGTFPTAAALYRMMAEVPTLLLDEVEALRSKQVSEVSQAILAVLNAGYRKGATVPRCDGPKNKLEYFPVYGPKAFAAIGNLPGTLADRSICIRMQRRTHDQVIARFSCRRTPKEAMPIRMALQGWAQRRGVAVEEAYDKMADLDFLGDRDTELWTPLFAICGIVVPDRVPELKQCALALTQTKTADDVDDSLPLKLLADVREVWPGKKEQLSTVSLLDKLKAISDSPWCEAGHELTPRRLSQLLRSFKVRPRQIRTAPDETVKGYLRQEFVNAFSSYLPPPDNKSETYETTRINTGGNDDFQSETSGQRFG